MKLDLYIRSWCPWCTRAIATLDRLGYAYTVHDLELEPGAREAMIALSGQERVPTLRAGEHVLGDFDPEQLLAFLERHSIQP
ncbi:MAG: hypothetical protein RLZZ244_1692 [Verrucomicrobiota bacterium]|jgi:glutaredoxin